MKLIKSFFTAALSVGIAFSAQAEYTAEDVENSFYPYKNGGPTFDGLVPGTTVVDESNADQFKDILVPHMYDNIKKGWQTIRVGETTSFELQTNYIKATRDAVSNPPVLDGNGIVQNFTAGRAFPQEPDANDPLAGQKMIWNYQYGYNWGDNAAIYPFYWKYRDLESGKVERTLKFNFHFLNYMHRVNQEPVPQFAENPSELFRAIYVQVLEPFDVKNTQLLIHRAEDDLKRDNTWLYLGFQRRVRRLPSGQITDSFLGADIMIEDFEGYNGRISDINWTYKGTKNIQIGRATCRERVKQR